MASTQHPNPQAHDDELVPRGALLALGGLLVATLALVAAVRYSGANVREPDAAPLVTARLIFRDLPDGSVAVINADTGARANTIQGEAGFLRGALRVLSHERMRRKIGEQEPFELVARHDGRLTLQDPQTGMRLDLESFGPQHAGNFARLITEVRNQP